MGVLKKMRGHINTFALARGHVGGYITLARACACACVRYTCAYADFASRTVFLSFCFGSLISMAVLSQAIARVMFHLMASYYQYVLL